MKFFNTLNERNLFQQYAQVLDWILCDGKFEKSIWDNKNKIQAFTKALHKLDRFSTSRLHYGAKKNITFPAKGDYDQFEIPTLFMSKGESEARDFVRHLRNGIAHGNVEVIDKGNELILELLDYGKEENQEGGQTA